MKTLTGDRTTPRRVSVVSGASVSRQKDGLGAGKEFPEDTYDKTLDLRAMGQTQLGCAGVPIFYGGAFKSENIRGFHLSLSCLLRAKVVVFAIYPNVFTEKNVFRGNNIAKLHVIAEKIAVFSAVFSTYFFRTTRYLFIFLRERGRFSPTIQRFARH